MLYSRLHCMDIRWTRSTAFSTEGKKKQKQKNGRMQVFLYIFRFCSQLLMQHKCKIKLFMSMSLSFSSVISFMPQETFLLRTPIINDYTDIALSVDPN